MGRIGIHRSRFSCQYIAIAWLLAVSSCQIPPIFLNRKRTFERTYSRCACFCSYFVTRFRIPVRMEARSSGSIFHYQEFQRYRPVCMGVLFVVSTLIKDIIKNIKADIGNVRQLILLTHNVYFHKEVSFNLYQNNKYEIAIK